MDYFGEAYHETNCRNCDNCLEPKETIDILSKKERVLLTKPTEAVQIAQKYFDVGFNHSLFVKEIVDYCKEHNVEPKAINVHDYNLINSLILIGKSIS